MAASLTCFLNFDFVKLSTLFMKVNSDKFFLLLSEKFLGIKIDNKLTLREHVEGLCNKASQKVSAVQVRFEQKSVSLIYS